MEAFVKSLMDIQTFATATDARQHDIRLDWSTLGDDEVLSFYTGLLSSWFTTHSSSL